MLNTKAIFLNSAHLFIHLNLVTYFIATCLYILYIFMRITAYEREREREREVRRCRAIPLRLYASWYLLYRESFKSGRKVNNCKFTNFIITKETDIQYYYYLPH